MNDIVCGGLREEHFPLAALAAYGLLLTCAEDLNLPATRLAWRQAPQWTGVLHLPAGVSKADLISRLCAAVSTDPDHNSWRRLPPAYPHQVPLSDFAPIFQEAAKAATPTTRRGSDALVAVGGEVVAGKGKDKNVAASALCMPQSGSSRWATRVRELDDVLACDAASATGAFDEALFGPWAYRQEQTSLGLDPSTVRLHAYRARNPVPEGTPHGMRGAVWLALQAFRLFPCAPVNRQLRTAGFTHAAPQRRDVLLMPVWTEPLALDALRSAVLLLGTTDRVRPEDLRCRGIAAVFSSVRMQSEHGTCSLAPAELVTDDA